jgi:putative Mg2+ transporter-C (MgtC) family protein
MLISFDLTYITMSLVKLSLSLICSSIISIERELHSHPGGLATHVLVGLGSCLFTMISVNLRDKFESPNADPARICAQIVSGMGFLGSATIFKSNNYVKGINTAANLWISAAISMAIGADLWELALITSGFTCLVLFINNGWKKFHYGKKKKTKDDKKILDNNKIEIFIADTKKKGSIELCSLRNFVTNIVNEQNLEKDDDEESIDAILDHDPLDAPYGDEDIDSEEENDDNYDKDDKDDKNDVTIFVTEADEENPKQIIKI